MKLDLPEAVFETDLMEHDFAEKIFDNHELEFEEEM